MTKGLNRRGRVSKCLRKSHSRQSAMILLRAIRLVTHKQSVLLPLRFAFMAAWFGKTVKIGVNGRQALSHALVTKMLPISVPRITDPWQLFSDFL
jgi:hypothetical protein